MIPAACQQSQRHTQRHIQRQTQEKNSKTTVFMYKGGGLRENCPAMSVYQHSFGVWTLDGANFGAGMLALPMSLYQHFFFIF